MSDFLDKLKARVADSQKRFTECQQKLQAAQAEFQAAQQEFTSWQHAFTTEQRREQQASVPPGGTPPVTANQPAAAPLPVATTTMETNKTEAIRDLLQQHPAGMTPGELWRAVKGQIAHRAYVYSVLKRLKDREQVTVRRGKYYFRVTPKLEDKQQVIVQ